MAKQQRKSSIVGQRLDTTDLARLKHPPDGIYPDVRDALEYFKGKFHDKVHFNNRFSRAVNAAEALACISEAFHEIQGAAGIFEHSELDWRMTYCRNSAGVLDKKIHRLTFSSGKSVERRMAFSDIVIDEKSFFLGISTPEQAEKDSAAKLHALSDLFGLSKAKACSGEVEAA